MGLMYGLLSLLTEPKKKITSFSKRFLDDYGLRKLTKDVFAQRLRFWSTKRKRRKREGKKELDIVVEAIGKASPNVQEPKSNKTASVEVDRVHAWLINSAFSNGLGNIQDDPNTGKQVPNQTSLDVNTFVAYFDPLQIKSTFDLRVSLIEQLPEFKYCKITRLNDGFFALKFPIEDQEIVVLEHGQLFIDNTPLILKRWSPSIDLVPTNFLSAIPIWVRFPNLNWAYWTQQCLSKISSIIGVPLFMDRGTATMARLDYARVCIEVRTDVLQLPDTVHMLRNGTIIPVPVEYEWKPLKCVICLSIYHDSGTCTFVGVGELTAERLQLLQHANATQGTPLNSSHDEDGVETISVHSGPEIVESSIEENLDDDALQERTSFLGQIP